MNEELTTEEEDAVMVDRVLSVLNNPESIDRGLLRVSMYGTRPGRGGFLPLYAREHKGFTQIGLRNGVCLPGCWPGFAVVELVDDGVNRHYLTTTNPEILLRINAILNAWDVRMGTQAKEDPERPRWVWIRPYLPVLGENQYLGLDYNTAKFFMFGK